MVQAKGQSLSPSVTGKLQTVQWQWEHRTGFRDYDEATVARIEAAFQRGESHVRLKAGKMKSTPMELFFVDMLQHDPVTHNVRNIRRVGPDSRWQRWKRNLKGLWIALETGRPLRMRFHQYQQMQANNLKSLDRRDISEVDLYHESGCCARVARSNWFAAAIMLAVVSNSIWLGIDANLNTHATIWEAEAGFQVAEHTFGFIFFVELLIRFGAYRRKKDSLKDSWFVFDATLVVFMLGETWIMLPVWLSGAYTDDVGFADLSVLRVARLLRLTKLGRIARLLRYTPEVRTMLKGLLYALRSVFVTLMLLMVLTYLFGIIFKTQAETIPALESKFPGVVASMWFLVLHGTFLDAVADEVPVLKVESTVLTVLFLVFIFLSSFTILNLLIGILCEVVTSVSRRERERAAVEYLKNNLLSILEVHDKDDDRHIRKDEFELLVRNPELHMILTNFGVDAEDLISLKDVLFDNRDALLEGISDDDETVIAANPATTSGDSVQRITFAEFMELVLRLRGGNGARVRDIVDLREYVRQRMDTLELQLPGEPRPFADGPGRPWGTGSAARGPMPASANPPTGLEAVVSQLADLHKETREMREHLCTLEQAQRALGS